MIICKLFLISLILVIIIDLSGIIDSIKFLIGKILKIRNYHNIQLKPFSCSFCMTWWVGLIYLCIIGSLNLYNIALVLLFAYGSDNIKDLLILGKDILIKITNKIYEKLNL